MKKVRITVMTRARHDDLIEKYENPLDNECDMTLGQVFIANGWHMPEGMCHSAWTALSPYVMALSYGASDFFDGWMKDKNSAMISCSDGFRPVSFLLERMDEDAST